MSRSRKKHAVLKDKNSTAQYWGTIRTNWKQLTKTFDWKETKSMSMIESRDEEEPLADKDFLRELQNEKELIYPDKRSIINDYDYIDWIYRAHPEDGKWYEKLKRK